MIDDTTRLAEQQVVGALLLSPDVVDDVLTHIRPSELYDPRLELILTAVSDLTRDGKPVDQVTVAEHLGPDLHRAGGHTFLAELTQQGITSQSAGYVAETVLRPAHLLRELVKVGARLRDLEGKPVGEVSVADVIDTARTNLDVIAAGRSVGSTAADDVYVSLDELEQDGGMPTPWRDLTEVLGGWRPGCLVYVGARPGVGKSTVGLEAALDMARRGQHVLICSLEMSKVELYHKLLSNVGSVDNKRITHRTLDQADWGRLAKAAAHIAALPLHVNDSGAQTVADIRAEARAIKRTHGNLGLVVVDYLQLMRSPVRVESRQQEVSQFSRALKLLAKELNTTVVALSQLNRGSEVRSDKRPSLSDLRESGSLEQDGDAVILLHREKTDPLAIELAVAKNRHGPADKAIRLEWSGPHSRISDVLPTPRY